MIIEKATELGMALSNSDEFRRLQAAKAAMDADKHVNELMEQYTQKQDKMVSMLENADSEGIEVSAIAKEIDDIQTELVENPVFEEMMEAQHCFANLMNEVNRTIGAYIGMNTEENSSSGPNDAPVYGGKGEIQGLYTLLPSWRLLRNVF